MTAKIKDYNFMGLRKIAAAFSLLLILISIGSLAIQGLKLGLDFTGGTLIEVSYETAANVGEIRRRCNCSALWQRRRSLGPHERILPCEYR
jgi:preprotein translocase subunit SecF